MIYSATAQTVDSPALNPKTWHHLATTYDGAMQKLYLDGDLVAEMAWAGTFTLIGSGIAIGRDNEGEQQWLN